MQYIYKNYKNTDRIQAVCLSADSYEDQQILETLTVVVTQGLYCRVFDEGEEVAAFGFGEGGRDDDGVG